MGYCRPVVDQQLREVERRVWTGRASPAELARARERAGLQPSLDVLFARWCEHVQAVLDEAMRLSLRMLARRMLGAPLEDRPLPDELRPRLEVRETARFWIASVRRPDPFGGRPVAFEYARIDRATGVVRRPPRDRRGPRVAGHLRDAHSGTAGCSANGLAPDGHA